MPPSDGSTLCPWLRNSFSTVRGRSFWWSCVISSRNFTQRFQGRSVIKKKSSAFPEFLPRVQMARSAYTAKYSSTPNKKNGHQTIVEYGTGSIQCGMIFTAADLEGSFPPLCFSFVASFPCACDMVGALCPYYLYTSCCNYMIRRFASRPKNGKLK